MTRRCGVRRALSLVALLGTGAPAQAGIPSYPLTLTVQAEGEAARLVARNEGEAPVTVHLPDGLPGEESDDAGTTYVVEPRSELVLGDVSDADGETVRYSFYVGRIGAEPDAGRCYRLPYPEGHAFTVSQAYGPGMTSHANAQNRYAVDFAMPEGVPILASRAGVVADATLRHREGGPQPSFGRSANRVTIVHDDGTVAQYAHLAHETPVVERGQRVQAGTLLGRSGNTGYTGGPHLHFVVTRPTIVAGKVKPVSIPICFYSGTPPVAFAPVVGMKPVAAYEAAPQPVALQPLAPY